MKTRIAQWDSFLKRKREGGERKISPVNLCKINIMSSIIHSIEYTTLVKILSAVLLRSLSLSLSLHVCVFICSHKVRESIHLDDVLLFHHQSILVGITVV